MQATNTPISDAGSSTPSELTAPLRRSPYNPASFGIPTAKANQSNQTGIVSRAELSLSSHLLGPSPFDVASWSRPKRMSVLTPPPTRTPSLRQQSSVPDLRPAAQLQLHPDPITITSEPDEEPYSLFSSAPAPLPVMATRPYSDTAPESSQNSIHSTNGSTAAAPVIISSREIPLSLRPGSIYAPNLDALLAGPSFFEDASSAYVHSQSQPQNASQHRKSVSEDITKPNSNHFLASPPMTPSPRHSAEMQERNEHKARSDLVERTALERRRHELDRRNTPSRSTSPVARSLVSIEQHKGGTRTPRQSNEGSPELESENGNERSRSLSPHIALTLTKPTSTSNSNPTSNVSPPSPTPAPQQARSVSSLGFFPFVGDKKKKRKSLDGKTKTKGVEVVPDQVKPQQVEPQGKLVKGPRDSKDPKNVAKSRPAGPGPNSAKPLREWNDETERILDLDLEDGPFTKTLQSGAAGRIRPGNKIATFLPQTSQNDVRRRSLGGERPMFAPMQVDGVAHANANASSSSSSRHVVPVMSNPPRSRPRKSEIPTHHHTSAAHKPEPASSSGPTHGNHHPTIVRPPMAPRKNNPQPSVPSPWTPPPAPRQFATPTPHPQPQLPIQWCIYGCGVPSTMHHTFVSCPRFQPLRGAATLSLRTATSQLLAHVPPPERKNVLFAVLCFFTDDAVVWRENGGVSGWYKGLTPDLEKMLGGGKVTGAGERERARLVARIRGVWGEEAGKLKAAIVNQVRMGW